MSSILEKQRVAKRKHMLMEVPDDHEISTFDREHFLYVVVDES
jgi:hypothetical protein